MGMGTRTNMGRSPGLATATVIQLCKGRKPCTGTVMTTTTTMAIIMVTATAPMTVALP